MAFAAPSLSDASAVSDTCQSLSCKGLERDERTDDDVGFRGFFLDDLGVIEVANGEFDLGKCVLDGFGFLL